MGDNRFSLGFSWLFSVGDISSSPRGSETTGRLLKHNHRLCLLPRSPQASTICSLSCFGIQSHYHGTYRVGDCSWILPFTFPMKMPFTTSPSSPGLSLWFWDVFLYKIPLLHPNPNLAFCCSKFAGNGGHSFPAMETTIFQADADSRQKNPPPVLACYQLCDAFNARCICLILCPNQR